jgi:hypothetical protein
MTSTLSIDEQLAQRAQEVAKSMGMNLDQLVRHYLEDLTAHSSAQEDMAELRRLSGQGDSRGWRFNRDEVHECSSRSSLQNRPEGTQA